MGELGAIARGQGSRDHYRDSHGVCGVQRFRTSGGALIYLMKVETFPDHVNNIYLITDGGRATLYDCGSQTAQSQEELKRAARVVREVYGEHDYRKHYSHLSDEELLRAPDARAREARGRDRERLRRPRAGFNLG